jgi:hypothetical protein
VLSSRECAEGVHLERMPRMLFPSSESRSKGILDLIHSYVSGSMSVASVQGASYYVTFIDDFSRKTWIFFMKTKDEVFSRFQEFKGSGGEPDRKEDQGLEVR